MFEVMVCKDTLPQAYHTALDALETCGAITDCDDWNCQQKELSMTMIVEHPLQEPMISKCFIGDPHSLEQYRLEMLDGILDFEIDAGNWEYTYHDRYAAQFPGLIRELKRNLSTRRAVMVIRRPEDIGSADPPCLQHIQYFVRDGKLDCCVLFRSNDACKATFMNAFALICLQKKIADELGVDVGTYTHRANSFHCYEKDFDLLRGYVQRIRTDMTVLAYDYEGDWKELMEDEDESIYEMAKELKERSDDRVQP